MNVTYYAVAVYIAYNKTHFHMHQKIIQNDQHLIQPDPRWQFLFAAFQNNVAIHLKCILIIVYK